MTMSEGLWERYGEYSPTGNQDVLAEVEELTLEQAAVIGLDRVNTRFRVAGTPKEATADDVVSAMQELGVEPTAQSRQVAQDFVNHHRMTTLPHDKW